MGQNRKKLQLSGDISAVFRAFIVVDEVDDEKS
jgi:hypothetical protein